MPSPAPAASVDVRALDEPRVVRHAREHDVRHVAQGGRVAKRDRREARHQAVHCTRARAGARLSNQSEPQDKPQDGRVTPAERAAELLRADQLDGPEADADIRHIGAWTRWA